MARRRRARRDGHYTNDDAARICQRQQGQQETAGLIYRDADKASDRSYRRESHLRSCLRDLRSQEG